MATFDPVFRVTCFDDDDVTVLAPVAGAPHSSDFKLATDKGVTGFFGYLEAPSGRRGRINVITRRPDTGTLTFNTLDIRTTLGGSNLSRFVTAFIGDDEGKERFKGKLFHVELSTDGPSGTFSRYFTGRCTMMASTARLGLQFTIKDQSDRLNRRCFVGLPHTSVTYAFPGSLFPIGITDPYGGLAVVPKVKGVLGTTSKTNFGGSRHITIDEDQFAQNRTNPGGNIITKRLYDALGRARRFEGSRRSGLGIRVRVEITSGPSIGQTGHWVVTPNYINLLFPSTNYGSTKDGDGRHLLTAISVDVLRNYLGLELAGDSNFLAIPADATTVKFDLVTDEEPTEQSPLFIQDIHPVTFLRDILDGFFGELSEGVLLGGSFGDGTWSVPFNASDFTSFISDLTWGTFRAPIAGPETDVRKWIENHIMVPFGLGYFYDADGDFRLVDMRRVTSSGSPPTFVTNDLFDSVAPVRRVNFQGSVNKVKVWYYVDRRIAQKDVTTSEDEYPDVNPNMIVSERVPMLITNFTDPAQAERILTIDAIGHRSFWDDPDQGLAAARVVEARLLGMVEQLKGPFQAGVVDYAYSLKLGATGLSTLNEGDLAILDFDETPDPATNLRGGPRLVRVTEVSPLNGPGVKVGCVDLGVDAVALVPTIGALSATSGEGAISLDVTVTLNAALEPVELNINITSTAVGTIPGEFDAGWLFAKTVYSTGGTFIAELTPGKRTWVRGRTLPQDANNLKIPSAYVFPSGDDFLDQSVMTAPTTVTADEITSSTALIGWTNTNSDLEVELSLTQGGDSIRVDRLAAGSDEYLIEFLDASTAYTVSVNYVDAATGGVSPTATKAFSTTGVAPICLDPEGMALIVGEVF